MKKNISSELAVGIVILIALTIGGIFLLQGEKQALEEKASFQKDVILSNKNGNTKIIVSSDTSKEKPSPTKCNPKYFDGEALVNAWLVNGKDDSSQLRVEIKSDDIEKLPTRKMDSANAHFIATLVDPTDEVVATLKNATSENPAPLTIHGFALTCQDYPQISLDVAVIAFKKI